MLNVTLKFRVSADEVSGWKVLAKADGLSLAAWIRSRCNWIKVPNAPRINVIVTPDSMRVRAAPSKAKKVCEHGTAIGFRCWQCGGKAKVEKE